MAELIHFEIRSFPRCLAVGRALRVKHEPDSTNPIPALWQEIGQSGLLRQALGLEGTLTTFRGAVGCMTEFGDDRGFLYLAGALVEPGTAVPDGLDAVELPAMTVAYGQVRGRIDDGDVFMSAARLIGEARDQAGYVFDRGANVEIEIYDQERFGHAMDAGGPEVVLDYVSGCVLQAE